MFPPQAPAVFLAAVRIPQDAAKPVQLLHNQVHRRSMRADAQRLLGCSKPPYSMPARARSGAAAIVFDPTLPGTGLNARASLYSSVPIHGDALLVSLTPSHCHLFQLLRPEAVRSSPVPLSPDAFSNWGAHNAAAHNAEVRAVTNNILQKQVVALAEALDAAAAAAVAQAGADKAPTGDFSTTHLPGAYREPGANTGGTR